MIKDIKGYEGLYQITDDGKVYSLRQNKFMSLKTTKDGYREVGLYKNGKLKHYRVHRLVAINYLENINNYPVINHKNEIKSDNRVENLEWCSISYNTKYSFYRNENIRKNTIKAREKATEKNKKKMTIDGIFFNSELEAAKYFNVDPKTIYNWINKGGINAHHQCQCF